MSSAVATTTYSIAPVDTSYPVSESKGGLAH